MDLISPNSARDLDEIFIAKIGNVLHFSWLISQTGNICVCLAGYQDTRESCEGAGVGVGAEAGAGAGVGAEAGAGAGAKKKQLKQ